MDFFDIFSDGLFDGLFSGGADGFGVESFSDFIGNFFEGGFNPEMGGASMEDVFAAGRMGRFAEGESIFSSLRGFINTGADAYIDYLFFKDVTGRGHDWKGFTSTKGAFSEEIAPIRDVLKSHSFIKSQLKKFAGDENIAQVLAEYEKLGLELPADELRERAYKTLAKKLHPDLHPQEKEVFDALFKQLNEANGHLSDTQKTSEYTRFVQDAMSKPEKKQALEDILNKVTDFDWQEMYEKAEQKRVLMIEDQRAHKESFGGKMGEKFSKLEKWQQGALVFAAVAGTGAAIYAAVKHMENKKKKQQQAQPQTMVSANGASSQKILNQPEPQMVNA